MRRHGLENPYEQLKALTRGQRIEVERLQAFIQGLLPRLKGETLRAVVIDADGLAVACTVTLEAAFGSKAVAAGTGVLLNNEMDDFSAKPGVPNAYGLVGAEANAIAPGKRPLSSMSPTILLEDGQPRMVLGTPGGSRIITMVLLGILDFMRGNEPESWVSLPRYHHQYVPDRIMAEPDAFTPDEVAEKAKAMGIESVAFDRGGYIYHGRVKALAEGARELAALVMPQSDYQPPGKAFRSTFSPPSAERSPWSCWRWPRRCWHSVRFSPCWRCPSDRSCPRSPLTI